MLLKMLSTLKEISFILRKGIYSLKIQWQLSIKANVTFTIFKHYKNILLSISQTLPSYTAWRYLQLYSSPLQYIQLAYKMLQVNFFSCAELQFYWLHPPADHLGEKVPNICILPLTHIYFFNSHYKIPLILENLNDKDKKTFKGNKNYNYSQY